MGVTVTAAEAIPMKGERRKRRAGAKIEAV
jgi:hypothetical protein